MASNGPRTVALLGSRTGLQGSVWGSRGNVVHAHILSGQLQAPGVTPKHLATTYRRPEAHAIVEDAALMWKTWPT